MQSGQGNVERVREGQCHLRRRRSRSGHLADPGWKDRYNICLFKYNISFLPYNSFLEVPGIFIRFCLICMLSNRNVVSKG